MDGYCRAAEDAGRHLDGEYFMFITQEAFGIQEDDEIAEAENVMRLTEGLANTQMFN
ncbi:MAG: hypothetical protein WCP22_03260 [Chlamydiota bacterium]